MTEAALDAGTATDRLRAARDFLLDTREDYDRAYREFRWPQLDAFNWALDWFDVLAAEDGARRALWIVEEDGSERTSTFAELSERSNRVANWLRAHGVARGDRIIVMLGNRVELWETILAAMKLGAVIIPATPLLAPSDLVDRVERGEARHVVADARDVGKFEAVPGSYTRVAVGEPVAGWLPYADADGADGSFTADGATAASDPLLLYFTSGTTAKPKLVEHSHVSYPIGHLSTMYWTGIRPGDVHMNLSSPGWGKHAWSNVYAPWLAEATVIVFNFTRFDAAALLDQIVRCEVTTFCAPPTVWRMIIQEDLGRWSVPLREALAAGEPLNPEIIEQIRRAWDLTIRDGYGQTETTAVIGNPPGQLVKPGSMGRPLPGYAVDLLDPQTGAAADLGEIALDLGSRPVGLMTGYRRTGDGAGGDAVAGSHYRTGDVASRDADGYITSIGRADDVFKASDYRISPFELESVLIEHEAVAEAAVVPSPDPLRLAVPKAYVTLTAAHAPTRETALRIMRFARERLAPYKRIRRLEFGPLPKTISGKIRRVELRSEEDERHAGGAAPGGRAEHEFWEEDFPELKA
jgi:acetyl-CoA synthetase